MLCKQILWVNIKIPSSSDSNKHQKHVFVGKDRDTRIRESMDEILKLKTFLPLYLWSYVVLPQIYPSILYIHPFWNRFCRGISPFLLHWTQILWSLDWLVESCRQIHRYCYSNSHTPAYQKYWGCTCIYEHCCRKNQPVDIWGQQRSR